MNYLLAENLTKSFGEKILFKDLNLSIMQGQKIALVARNGAGKTSFLKILMGKDIPDSGEVRISKDITIGYLEQDPQLDDTKSVIENVVFAENPIVLAIEEYEQALDDHTSNNSEFRLQEAMNRMDSLKAWDYEQKMKQILTNLKIVNLNQLAGTLSGGQKKRVALAKILIQEPDFMILDEPTNHLDLDMIEWLEAYLTRQKMTLLLVTHDRYFLDRITEEIIELDQKQIFRYKGHYEYYLEKKSERETNQVRGIDKARSLLRKELEWMRRQPKARGTKQKARIDSFYETKEKASQKLEEKNIILNVKMNRQGGKILELKHVSKSYGDFKALQSFTYTFSKGEKIGIVGPNGVGKSTFLNVITGIELPDGGKVNPGDTTVFGYYTQEGLKIPDEKRVIEVVKDIAEVIPLGSGENLSASQFLEYFGFEPEMQFTPVGKLSGGERRRLHLMTVLIKNPNFLILDEPTNDLDLLTLNTLEEFLQHFQGCLLIVSHDRYFMDKLVDHLFIFEGQGVIRDFNGTYSNYRDKVEEDEKMARSNQRKGIVPVAAPVLTLAQPEKKKLSFNEKREYDSLESEIAALESRRKLLEQKMSEGNASHIDITAWSKEIEKILIDIDKKTERWMVLGERA
jgi:ATP-binding cassette subfamily F protein uup